MRISFFLNIPGPQNYISLLLYRFWNRSFTNFALICIFSVKRWFIFNESGNNIILRCGILR